MALYQTLLYFLPFLCAAQDGAGLDAYNASNIVMNKSDGISIQGDNLAYNVYATTSNSNNFFSISGQTGESLDIILDEDGSVTISADTLKDAIFESLYEDTSYVLDGKKNTIQVTETDSGGLLLVTSSYIVTFNANSGTMSTSTMTTGTDGRLISLPTPVFDGYTFDGWYTALNGGEEITTETVFSEDTTVYAHWRQNITPPEPTTFTITFDVNGGAVNPSTMITGIDGRLISLPTPTRNGYTFDGWYTALNGGEQITTETVFSKDTTVYAHWTQNITPPEPTTYTITFDANGGVVDSSTIITGMDGKLISLPTPTHNGYTFNGWYTALNGGEQITTETVFSEDTTVYAHWTQNVTPPEPITYTITFNANSGTVSPMTMTTGENGTLASLPILTRDGYTFDGWYTAAIGGSKVTTDTVFMADTTVYAHWSQTGSGSGSNGSSWGGITPITNPVIIVSPTHGTVTVNPATASNGSTVTITTVPDDGYELSSLTVTDKNGKEIALTDKGNGIFTFTMPNSQVSVNAVFQKIETAWSNPFTDVAESAWYYDAVKFANENGLMNGIGNGLFAPKSNLSRAMLAQILYNKEGKPSVNGTGAFADVASGAWYANAVAWAAANGIVNGYGNGRFGPNDSITREQLAVMLWRYAGEPAATDKELHFNDADKASGYALDALYWAVENGIINGKGNGILY